MEEALLEKKERRLPREDDCRQRIAWKCSGRRRRLVTARRPSVLSIGSGRLAVAPRVQPTALERMQCEAKVMGQNDTAAAACYPLRKPAKQKSSLINAIARLQHMRQSIHRLPSPRRACYRLPTRPLPHSTGYVLYLATPERRQSCHVPISCDRCNPSSTTAAAKP